VIAIVCPFLSPHLRQLHTADRVGLLAAGVCARDRHRVIGQRRGPVEGLHVRLRRRGVRRDLKVAHSLAGHEQIERLRFCFVVTRRGVRGDEDVSIRKAQSAPSVRLQPMTAPRHLPGVSRSVYLFARSRQPSLSRR
jgi:hypothetical protein